MTMFRPSLHLRSHLTSGGFHVDRSAFAFLRLTGVYFYNYSFVTSCVPDCLRSWRPLLLPL